MFTLPILTRPSYSDASSSSTGAIILQGPHHSAQKSTRTGTGELKTSAEKLPSVSVTIFAAAIMKNDQIAVSIKNHPRYTTLPRATTLTTAAATANPLSTPLIAATGATAGLRAAVGGGGIDPGATVAPGFPAV